MKSIEHEIQKAFFKWVDLRKGQIKCLDLFHAQANGGHRQLLTAVKLKAEGVRAGVLDTQLPVARGGFIGLAIKPHCFDSPKFVNKFVCIVEINRLPLHPFPLKFCLYTSRSLIIDPRSRFAMLLLHRVALVRFQWL